MEMRSLRTQAVFTILDLPFTIDARYAPVAQLHRAPAS